jgi:hypothetical protein
MLAHIRRVTGNLDRALSDLKAGDSLPIVKAIAGCETRVQSALLAAIVCANLAPSQIQDLVDALATVALHEIGAGPGRG